MGIIFLVLYGVSCFMVRKHIKHLYETENKDENPDVEDLVLTFVPILNTAAILLFIASSLVNGKAMIINKIFSIPKRD